MVLPWRRRRDKTVSAVELTIPTYFRCPISLELMKDPVTLSTGITYDRDSIEKWTGTGNNKSHGVERIPTPRIPISPPEVIDICAGMVAATRRGDAKKCVELVVKVMILAKESERNKRCIVENGIGSVLADTFEYFTRFAIDIHENLLKEILSTLAWAPQLTQQGISKLKSTNSLHCMALFLKDEDLLTRRNTISVLKELVCADRDYVDRLAQIDGIQEILFQILEVPICPNATQACLVVIHHMMVFQKATGVQIISKFIQMGLIPLILELLVDGNRSVCDKALAVLDRTCSTKEGREIMYENALTIPLLVKKIRHVSDAATDLSISIMYKLFSGEDGSYNGVIEAVKLGAFQKLLVVLQVGCGRRTKEKITQLFKMMNMCRDKIDCFESYVGSKYLKAPN
ncbi:U-box domain-containing protein 21 [Dorcoceras hygrometricum]|uniref:U-box domain-containing protein n=1 Tax=Dorcoceras hygrometricum TaxID=472368 RepID=A0A2Z7B8T5_9LAMI|nr:U-box domain-containing protein 21 [Dorcoceras hygrometricum]